jgi:hypothetical protein
MHRIARWIGGIFIAAVLINGLVLSEGSLLAQILSTLAAELKAAIVEIIDFLRA